jgi:uncharacterized membrane protein YoaK (UPF0700 family)
VVELVLWMRSASTRAFARRGWSETASPAADRLARTLPFVLSVIAGTTDVIGFLGFNGLFTAHITGNFVVAAAHILAGNPAILSHILSVPVFMMVLLSTSLIGGAIERTGRPSLRPLLLLQLLMLTAFFLLSVTAGPWRDADAMLAVVAAMCGVAAMAVQNALVQIALSNTPSTAVMTTNVTHLARDLGAMLVGGDAVGAKNRALRTLPVIVGFTIGCGLGAAAEAATHLWSLVLPTALAVFAFAMSMSSTPTGEARQ